MTNLQHVGKSINSPARPRDIAATIFALILPTLVTLVYFVWAEQFSARVEQTTYALVKVIQFAFPAVWVLMVQKHRPRIIHPVTKGIGFGLVFGLAVGAAMLAAYHAWLKTTPFYLAAEDSMRQKIAGFELTEPWKFAVLGVFYSLIHSFLEEYYWRWFVFGQFRRFTPLGVAIAISSFGFAAHHVIVLADYFGYGSPVTWIFALGIAVGGAVWAWLYNRTGSILGPWLSHLLVDAAIFVVGYELVRTHS